MLGLILDSCSILFRDKTSQSNSEIVDMASLVVLLASLLTLSRAGSTR